MKTKRLFPVLIFLAGFVAGGALLSILSFTSPNPPVDAIGSIDAKTFFQRYTGRAIPYSGVIKGYMVDKEQYDAMTLVLAAYPGVIGFRIYNGIDNGFVNVGMVVGVNSNGTDALTIPNTVFKTVARYVGPCPPVCDASSPITAP